MVDVQEIKLPGTFDYSYHRTFIDTYQKHLDEGVSRLVIDFTRVDYLDSSALGMLVMLQKKANEKGTKIAIKGAKGATADILKMANMQKLFEFL